MQKNNRYTQLFQALKQRREKAFIPFFMLADPSPEVSLDCIDAAVKAGADALELGIGFSDPVADGPVIEKAHQRALKNSGGLGLALELLAEVRSRYPEIPIGILTYASMVYGVGISEFVARLSAAGVDSLLVADCPWREAEELSRRCEDTGVNAIFIAPPGATEELIAGLSTLSSGYIYLVSRPGVTGVDTGDSVNERETQRRQREERAALIARLKQNCQIPIIQGFGISSAEQVRDALDTGVDGVICGSALVQKVADYTANPGLQAKAELLAAISDKVKTLKQATMEAD